MSDKCSSQYCAYRCWEVTGGILSLTPTGVTNNVMRHLFPVLGAWILHIPCPSSSGWIPVPADVKRIPLYPSWDRYFCILKYRRYFVVGPFIKFSLLCLKPVVYSTWLKSIVVTCESIQWLWRAEDRMSLQTILLWFPFPLIFFSPLTFYLDFGNFALRFSSAVWSRIDAWTYMLPPSTMARCGIQTLFRMWLNLDRN